MPSPEFNKTLAEEYQSMFNNCNIRPAVLPQAEHIITRMLGSKSRYETVSLATRTPWQVISLIHTLECSMNFKLHLHNGDPLTARTVHVPKGRPVSGNPPFSWEESAIDALLYEGLNKIRIWSLPRMLYTLEGYNGFGYRKPSIGIPSPYLWSGSNWYEKGKFTSDGKFDPEAVSKQTGAAVILRRMAELGLVAFGQETLSAPEYLKLVVYDPLHYNTWAENLQIFLNQFPGIYLLEDGKAGEKTSSAFKKVFGSYLKGDPRDK
jgi:lysozyme family protein